MTVMGDSPIYVTDINFPAVTICPSLRLGTETKVMKWILDLLDEGDIKIDNFTEIQYIT